MKTYKASLIFSILFLGLAYPVFALDISLPIKVFRNKALREKVATTQLEGYMFDSFSVTPLQSPDGKTRYQLKLKSIVRIDQPAYLCLDVAYNGFDRKVEIENDFRACD